jgi:hypothetical protein
VAVAIGNVTNATTSKTATGRLRRDHNDVCEDRGNRNNCDATAAATAWTATQRRLRPGGRQ